MCIEAPLYHSTNKGRQEKNLRVKDEKEEEVEQQEREKQCV